MTQLCVLPLLATSLCVTEAQISQEEHLSHHPEQGGGASNTRGPAFAGPKGPGGMGGPGGGMMGGGMGGMMDGMMEKMGAPKPRDLYPSMMGIPEMDPDARSKVSHEGLSRMQLGTELMVQAMDRLNRAAATDDFQMMQESVSHLREGLAQFDSGLAARRAISEGKAPRNVALQWFKKEMNLVPARSDVPSHALGGSGFHLVVIGILVSFSVVMIWMYFFKMRRASALVKELSSVAASASNVAEAKPVVLDRLQASPPMAVPMTEPVVPPKFPDMKNRTEPVHKWSGQLRVCRIFEESPGVKTFRLASPDEVALPFTYYPGQFVTLSLSLEGKTLKRSYTIASSPTQMHYCGLTVKREPNGMVSRFLHDQVNEGDLLEVSGPTGKFVFTGQESDRILLIGGGVGITPLMSVVRYLTDIGWGKEINLLYCCRTPEDFIYKEELELLQERHSNLHVAVTITRPEGTAWMGLTGRFTPTIIKHLVPEVQNCRIHVCGPGNMMGGVLESLNTLKVPTENIKTEAFGPAKKPKALSKSESKNSVNEVLSNAVAVSFKRTGKSAPMSSDQTVLDVADEAGVQIDSSCRSGQCGLCKVRLLAGEVTMECDDSLSADERKEGQILACQAKATKDIEVDA